MENFSPSTHRVKNCRTLDYFAATYAVYRIGF
jgi:hypothetical protein